MSSALVKKGSHLLLFTECMASVGHECQWYSFTHSYLSGIGPPTRDTHTHSRLTALCPGLPGWAGTRKVKPNLDFTEARDSEWQLRQLGHMQGCISLQTDNHASSRPLSFYRLDALPATQPTASKHWRHNLNTPPHPICVATLPCEISVFKKSQFLRSKWSKLLCKT